MNESFSVKVNYDDSAQILLQNLIGDVSENQLARLVGAMDGSLIDLQRCADKLFVRVFHPFVKVQDLFISRDSRNEIFIYFDRIELRKQFQGQGIYRNLFVRQVEEARKLNVQYFALFAEGNYGSQMNGYYSWAKFGFNAFLTKEEIADLPDFLGQARTVNDIMLFEGDEYWRIFGTAKEMNFDVSEHSRQVEVLVNYVKDKIKHG
jgi:GNAT superfamily N-acetyltransferase